MSDLATLRSYPPSRSLGCRKPAALLLVIALAGPLAFAGGPKYVAGTSYFNPGMVGMPIHWANGQVSYFVDRGPLNSSMTNQQATAMVDAAAALWSAVPTAGVALKDMGTLSEDVNGSNIAVTNGTIASPADVTAAATSTPLGVIFDADGSVIDALYGTGASEPISCQNNGVFLWIDNINADTTIAHAAIVLNGLCATNANLLTMMSFELERAFGRALGLDYAQVNPGALNNGEPGGTFGWPVMQPQNGLCGPQGGACIPNPGVLRWDDIAALNRIYPITSQNQASFPGKLVTAANTVSIQGTIAFVNGEGMQGVNVVARPLDSNGNPLYQYTVSFVSGAYFNGNHGNAVMGWSDDNGNPLTMWGSNNAALQGYFDLSGIPLPPNMTKANYMVTFEPVSPQYILESSVGPYTAGTPSPSGTLEPIAVPGLAAGSVQRLNVNVTDSAVAGWNDAIGTRSLPRRMPVSGMWRGRLSRVGQTDWFSFPVRGGRTFTVVALALDETGAPSETKAMPALGVWDGFDATNSPAVGASPALNGNAAGETWLRVSTSGGDVVRLGIADQRGDGRPDYAYCGWLLYADTVLPRRLPVGGGQITIRGVGFHAADTVQVGGRAATVISVTPNRIVAMAPPAASGVTGSVDVEVDDLPVYYAAAIISGGVSYDAAASDALKMVAAPGSSVQIGVPQPFSVAALGADLTGAGGVTVTFKVTSGTAALACGQKSCAVTTTGDGRATMSVTAASTALSIVTASLANGSMVETQFTGAAPPTIAALTPQLSVAAGTTFAWPVQALVMKSGAPAAGQSVTWQTAAGFQPGVAGAVMTNASGIAAQTLTVGPLAEGQLTGISACLTGTSQCATFKALGSRPEYATLVAVSGTQQSLPAGATPAPIVLRVLDMDGKPMAAGTVTLNEALFAWAPPCPPTGRCAQIQLLARKTVTAISALDGTVSFTPLTLAGVGTRLLGVATTGNTSAVPISIEQQ